MFVNNPEYKYLQAHGLTKIRGDLAGRPYVYLLLFQRRIEVD